MKPGEELSEYAKLHGLEQWEIEDRTGETYLGLYIEDSGMTCALIVGGSLEKVSFSRSELMGYIEESGEKILKVIVN